MQIYLGINHDVHEAFDLNATGKWWQTNLDLCGAMRRLTFYELKKGNKDKCPISTFSTGHFIVWGLTGH